ncbi:MAG: ferrous iron transport protein A [Cyclobacteriaceae bacterium]|nr:ferrous iron transport protein A [Cyclobacteriaceae bacterium]
MSIAEMKNGEVKTITGFTDDELSLKLMEMGCLPGTSVKFNYVAPFGDPVCIQVEGYDLSLRVIEAASVTVE